MVKVVYATLEWGVHDERWLAALREVGFDPIAVSRGGSPPESFREAVLDAAGGTCPVLAGPLDSVAIDLACLPLQVVGLSWGYDIPFMSDLRWVASLQGIIVDSKANERALMDAGVPSERITFLPWGVDLDLFTPEGPHRRPAGVPADHRIILSLRAHEPRYHVETIIAALACLGKALGDTQLVVGHSGSMTEQLRSQSSLLGVEDRVHFIGTVPEAELPALLRASDCYVSASEVDGTSVTLLQAMACGVPVVVSNIEGNRSWAWEGVTGWLFDVDDADGTAKAITLALADTTTVPQARALIAREASWRRNVWRLRDALATKNA